MNYKKRYKKGNYRMFLTGGADDAAANAMNMYNTGQIGSGANPIGTTSTIVEQESNPELQQARIEAMTEQQRLLMQQQAEVQQQNDRQIAEDEIINEQKLLQANAQTQAKLNQTEGIASTAIKTGAEFLAPEVVAANQLKNANAYSQLGSDVIQGFKAMKPVQEFTQTIPGSMQLTSMGTAAGTGFKAGLGQVAQGLGKFAKTGAGIGTMASLAGAGISRLSDDDDPTTLNFGEGAGGVLSSAGTGASLGSLLGPAGTLIGGVAGGLYGLGKGLFSRNRARRDERELEQESATARNVHVNRFNEDLMSNYGSQLSSIRQGELNQKSISGQDLGYNLVARNGGVRSYDHGGPHDADGGRVIGPGTLEQYLSTQNVIPEVNVTGGGTPPMGLYRGSKMLGTGFESGFSSGADINKPTMPYRGSKMLGTAGNLPYMLPGVGSEGVLPGVGSEGMPPVPMVRRGGGMRMGMPRYGYAV